MEDNQKTFAYTIHNLIAHPVSEVVWLASKFAGLIRLTTLADCLTEASKYIHDATLPKGDR